MEIIQNYSCIILFIYIICRHMRKIPSVGRYRKREACDDELIRTRKLLEAQTDRLSYLGRIIRDQPRTAFPDEINSYIASIEG